jgi:hypothetical protein
LAQKFFFAHYLNSSKQREIDVFEKFSLKKFNFPNKNGTYCVNLVFAATLPCTKGLGLFSSQKRALFITKKGNFSHVPPLPPPSTATGSNHGATARVSDVVQTEERPIDDGNGGTSRPEKCWKKPSRRKRTNAKQQPIQEYVQMENQFSSLHASGMMASAPLHTQQSLLIGPFRLKWVEGTRISKCYGCARNIQNPPIQRPNDLVIMCRDLR